MNRIRNITKIAKESFRVCIKNRDLDCVLSMYHKNAVLKGTFNKKTVQGYTDIQKYFKKLFKRVNDVKFEKGEILFSRGDLIFENGNYTFFQENGEKIRANYQLVLSEVRGKYKILSHFSSLRWCFYIISKYGYIFREVLDFSIGNLPLLSNPFYMRFGYTTFLV